MAQVSFVEMLLCPLNMGARIPSSNKLIAQGEIDNQDENSASIYMSIKEILSDGRSLLKRCSVYIAVLIHVFWYSHAHANTVNKRQYNVSSQT